MSCSFPEVMTCVNICVNICGIMAVSSVSMCVSWIKGYSMVSFWDEMFKQSSRLKFVLGGIF